MSRGQGKRGRGHATWPPAPLIPGALPGNVNILTRPATNSGPSSVWIVFRTCQFGRIFSSARQCAQTFISLTNICRFVSGYLRFGRWRSRFSIRLSPVRVSPTFLPHITTHHLESQGGVLPYLPSVLVVLTLRLPESLFSQFPILPLISPSRLAASPPSFFVFKNEGRCPDAQGVPFPSGGWKYPLNG